MRVVALARNAGKAGEASRVARNLVAKGANGKPLSLIKNSSALRKDADAFMLTALKRKGLKLIRVTPKTRPLEGLKLDTFGPRILTGAVANNSATKVIKMSVSGVLGKVGGAGYILDKGNDVREKYNTYVENRDKFVDAVKTYAQSGQSHGN